MRRESMDFAVHADIILGVLRCPGFHLVPWRCVAEVAPKQSQEIPGRAAMRFYQLGLHEGRTPVYFVGDKRGRSWHSVRRVVESPLLALPG